MQGLFIGLLAWAGWASASVVEVPTSSLVAVHTDPGVDVIILEPGEAILTETWVVDRPVTLRGSGITETTLRLDGIQVRAGGTLRLESISLDQLGGDRPLVHIEGGALHTRSAELRGHGLTVVQADGGRAELSQTWVGAHPSARSVRAAIAASGGARVHLDDTKICGGGPDPAPAGAPTIGVLIRDPGTEALLTHRTEVGQCAGTGVVVRTGAQLQASAAAFWANPRAGIRVTDAGSSAHLASVVLHGNGTGISVEAGAGLLLSESILSHNGPDPFRVEPSAVRETRVHAHHNLWTRAEGVRQEGLDRLGSSNFLTDDVGFHRPEQGDFHLDCRSPAMGKTGGRVSWGMHPTDRSCIGLSSQVLPAAGPIRRALVVGVGEYAATSGIAPIQGAVRDAELVAAALTRRGYRVLPPLLNEQATRGAVDNALDALEAASAPGDQVLIYIAAAGSGATHKDQQAPGMILLHDAHQSDPSSGSLALGSLRNRLGHMQARSRLILLDTCWTATEDGPASLVQAELADTMWIYAAETNDYARRTGSRYPGGPLSGVFTLGLLRAWSAEERLSGFALWSSIRRYVLDRTSGDQSPALTATLTTDQPLW